MYLSSFLCFISNPSGEVTLYAVSVGLTSVIAQPTATYKRLTTDLQKANRWEVHCLHWQRRISLLSLTHIISIANSEYLSRVFLSFFSSYSEVFVSIKRDIRSIARCQAFVKSYSEYIQSFVYTTFCMSVLHVARYLHYLKVFCISSVQSCDRITRKHTKKCLF